MMDQLPDSEGKFAMERNLQCKQKESIERKEELTYSTGCAMYETSSLLEKKIAPARITPNEGTIVFFDFETTGLSLKFAEVCQIAAKCKDKEFNAFIIPVNGIPNRITDITGLKVIHGKMYYKNDEVISISQRTAFTNFLSFLRDVGTNIILVAHNGLRYDVPILLRDIQQNGLWDEFTSIVSGFSDTLIIFKQLLPDRKELRLKFNQGELAKDILNEDVSNCGHNALHDVQILSKIVDKLGVTPNHFIKSAVSVGEFIYEKTKIKDLNFLQPSVSVGMIKKIATADITEHILREVYQKEQGKGIEMLLAEDFGGHPRITKNKRVIRNVITELENHLKFTSSDSVATEELPM